MDEDAEWDESWLPSELVNDPSNTHPANSPITGWIGSARQGVRLFHIP